MRAHHPFPCFSGLISLEVFCSLDMTLKALEDLEDKHFVHRLTNEEKSAKKLRLDFDLYVLTDAGYKISSGV
jgi:hypothetical protein